MGPREFIVKTRVHTFFVQMDTHFTILLGDILLEDLANLLEEELRSPGRKINFSANR